MGRHGKCMEVPSFADGSPVGVQWETHGVSDGRPTGARRVRRIPTGSHGLTLQTLGSPMRELLERYKPIGVPWKYFKPTGVGHPWETRGRHMGDPWETHGRPMGEPYAHGSPMGVPWVCGGPVVVLSWDSHGNLMGRPWDHCAVSCELQWYPLGLLLGPTGVECSHGSSTGLPWVSRGTHIWRTCVG